MGAFPALAISQALPETPMESYQRAAGLKSTLLENQQREQAVQQGAQQQRDQQAATQAMQSWDGKNFMELPSLILKHGGSAQAATAAQQAALARQEKLSQIAKQDAETGSTNLKNEAAKNDAILGRLQAVTEGPDEGLADRLTAAGQDAVQAGHLDPQHAQQLQQLATLPPDQLRSQLGLFEKGLMGQKQQFDQAQDTAKQKTAQQNADTAQWKEAGQGTLVNLKTGQLIHGVAPVEQQELQDWLNKHNGKGPADFMAAKAALAPTINFALQSQGVNAPPVPTTDQGGKPLTFEQQVKTMGPKGGVVQAIIEGRQQPPASFAQKTPYWQDVMQKVYQIDPQFNEQRAQLRKGYTVGNQSKEINAINTAMGHVGVLGDAIDALNNGDVRVLNQVANRLGLETGSDKMTTFKTIVHRVGPELSKAYVGAGGSAGERGADEKDFDPNLSPTALKSNVGITAKLLRSKIGSLENQWDTNKAPSMKSFQDQFLSKEAVESLDKYSPKSQGGNAGGGNNGAADPLGIR